MNLNLETTKGKFIRDVCYGDNLHLCFERDKRIEWNSQDTFRVYTNLNVWVLLERNVDEMESKIWVQILDEADSYSIRANAFATY